MFGWNGDAALETVIAPADVKLFAKHFGYHTVGDLLGHLPRTHAAHGESVALGNVEEGDLVTVIGEVRSAQTNYDRRGNLMLKISIDDGNTRIAATFFNARWIQQHLTQGRRGMFAGKLKYFKGQPQLQHPDYVLFPDENQRIHGRGGLDKAAPDIEQLTTLLQDLRYIPIYPAKKAMPSWRILGNMHQVCRYLNNDTGLISKDYLPDPARNVVPPELPTISEALTGVHFPDERGPEVFFDRLKYQEALALACVLAERRQELATSQALELQPRQDGLSAKLVASLPFPLTQGQQDIIATIAADLRRAHPMHRLLQGEVGSGKTLVALAAMLQAVDAGAQCAFLAPTEVLASQHAASIKAMVDAAELPVHVVLLTGSLPTKIRQQALLDILSGDAQIIVGTHALIQDSVEFFKLGLCIIDEQHRFGVEQREQLRLKAAQSPHVLVMTATPIPRTVAMTVFGDLDISTLRELPGGRQPIESFVVTSAQPRWVERMLGRVAEEISQGRQAYIVCHRIQGEGGVEAVAAQLQHSILGHCRIGVLHGQLDAEDKMTVMDAYQRGELDILVATTVIEVGVDVPNATVMIIRDAENFGISQLHQLRGRVGRGGHASICFFYTQMDAESPAVERLTQVAATMNGFELAELDLELRHEGDVTTGQQSGRNRTLKLLNVIRDQDMVARANTTATQLVIEDPELAATIAGEITTAGQEYLTKT
ncbi:MAG: ATP-dependent DNA helicase RecG [Corynebacterium sp.]|nr:ATP-dependent DNA helicase RecG [Corynebacterium sp.]